MLKRFKENTLVLYSLLVVSIIYFCLFIPINFSGSDELSKIRIFSSIDEYSQIVALEQMLQTGGKSWKHILGDFLLHNHAYGYPFFFFSSLVAIPIKLIHLPRPQELQWMMLALRQQVVLFNIISCLLLAHLWTGFRQFLSTIFLFLFLLTIPALAKHNIIWHPDALSTLFIVLTLYGLVRDSYRLRKWFYISAIACGFACSTKFMGPFLFLLVFSYLWLTWKQRILQLKSVFTKTIVYGVITIFVFILSSPLIFFGYYKNVIAYLTDQSKMNNFGWGVEMPKGLLPWYDEVIADHYFHWWLILPLVGLSLYTIFKKEKNWELNLLTLAAILPLFIYVVSTIGHKNYFYLYPVFLLLASSAINAVSLFSSSKQRIPAPVLYTFLAISCIGMVVNAWTSFKFYQEKSDLIGNYPGYNFYRKIKEKKLLNSRQPDTLTVMHSPFIYLPDSLKLHHEMPYGLLNEALIEKQTPDLIIFEKKDADLLSDTAYQNHYIDPPAARESSKFFQAALQNRLAGYSIGLLDNYGLVLIKNQK